MANKPKLLAWSDWFGVGTGFGTVSKHVLKSLLPYFKIDQLAINYNGEFFDQEKWPIQVVPARLNNASDPHGTNMFMKAVATGRYDYIWIMNDSFVVNKVGQELPKLFEQMAKARKKIPCIVYYCPIDCNLQSHAVGMLDTADHVVAYCDFGKEEILKTLPDIKDKLSVITHGIDTAAFHRINSSERKLAREQLLKVTDDDTFVWMNVNRNSMRKDLARTILAFSEFRKKVPNSRLYLHTMPRDTTIDLLIAVKEAGLTIKDVLFPGSYSPDKPYPTEVLNSFYNCADAFMTTTLGEGWGLTHLDAAQVGIPILAPNNTCFPEQLNSGSRGYLYPCAERYWVDNSGYRPIGRLDDIVANMHKCYEETKSGTNKQMLFDAKEYANSISWNKIGNQWIKLFQTIRPMDRKPTEVEVTGVKL